MSHQLSCAPPSPSYQSTKELEIEKLATQNGAPYPLSRLGLINGMPVTIIEPSRIGLDRNSVVVSMPAVVSVCSVLDIQNRVPVTRLSEGGIFRLRFRQAEYL